MCTDAEHKVNSFPKGRKFSGKEPSGWPVDTNFCVIREVSANFFLTSLGFSWGPSDHVLLDPGHAEFYFIFLMKANDNLKGTWGTPVVTYT